MSTIHKNGQKHERRTDELGLKKARCIKKFRVQKTEQGPQRGGEFYNHYVQVGVLTNGRCLSEESSLIVGKRQGTEVSMSRHDRSSITWRGTPYQSS